MSRRASWCVAGFAVLAAVGMAKANLLENGGFETGVLDPWKVVLGEVSVESAEFHGFFSPHGGAHMAVLSPDTYQSSALAYFDLGPCDGPASLSLYYNLVSYNEGDTSASDFAALYFTGETIATATLTDPPGGCYTETGWQLFTTVLDTGSTGGWIGFDLWNDGSPLHRAMVLLDDVSIVPVPDGGVTGQLLAVAAAAIMLGASGHRVRLE